MGWMVIETPRGKSNSMVAVVVLHRTLVPPPSTSNCGESDDRSTDRSSRQAFTAHDPRHTPVRRSRTRFASATSIVPEFPTRTATAVTKLPPPIPPPLLLLLVSGVPDRRRKLAWICVSVPVCHNKRKSPSADGTSKSSPSWVRTRGTGPYKAAVDPTHRETIGTRDGRITPTVVGGSDGAVVGGRAGIRGHRVGSRCCRVVRYRVCDLMLLLLLLLLPKILPSVLTLLGNVLRYMVLPMRRGLSAYGTAAGRGGLAGLG